MPLMPSPFSAVPNFIQQPAMPPVGPTTPPGGMMTPQTPGQMGATPGGPGGSQEPDLFEKVAKLLISNPMWLQVFAGMGLREALEKSGKYRSVPHRSNEELAAQGVNTGIPGQTGQPSPQQMMAQLRPPGLPGMGPASMGGGGM